jgi:hypothetical protein
MILNAKKLFTLSASAALMLLASSACQERQPPGEDTTSADVATTAPQGAGRIHVPSSILLPDGTSPVSPEVARAAAAISELEIAVGDEQTSEVRRALEQFESAAADHIALQPADERAAHAETLDRIRETSRRCLSAAEAGNKVEATSATLMLRDIYLPQLQGI